MKLILLLLILCSGLSLTWAVALNRTTKKQNSKIPKKEISRNIRINAIRSQSNSQTKPYIVRYNSTVKEFKKFVRFMQKKVNQANAMDIQPLNHVERTFKIGIEHGVYAWFSSSMVKSLKRRQDVLDVEEDVPFVLDAIDQTGAPWNLVKSSLSNYEMPLSSTQFQYPEEQGKDVVVFVVDSGISNHSEFGDRVQWGGTFCPGCENRDSDGHGTHVAGIIGAQTYGVAKKVHLVAVKVCEGNQGYVSSVLKGLQFIVNEVKSKSIQNAIVNVCGHSERKSEALDAAIDELIHLGIHVVVSAGNQNRDACQQQSPSDIPDLIKVGALDRRDRRTKYSNFGTCVDVFAPGEDVRSTWMNQTTVLNQGTSAAAPHAAGALALLLSKVGKAAPGSAKLALLEISVKDKMIGNLKNSPNRILNIAALNKAATPALLRTIPKRKRRKDREPVVKDLIVTESSMKYKSKKNL